MKKSILAILCALSPSAFAQPTLTESAYLPVGSQLTISVHPGAISPGSSGAGQTWNLSALTYTTIGPMSVVIPGSTSCGSQFPSSNYAVTIPNGDVLYSIRSSSVQEQTGHSYPGCTGSLIYTDNMIEYAFPFSYLDSITDTFSNNVESGTVKYVYDGYGTMITPFGTFNNTGRIKMIGNTATEYLWFSGTTFQYPLARTINNNSTTLLYSNFVSANPEIITKDQKINIFPNPFDTQLSFSLEANEETKISIYDLLGNKVWEETFTNSATINTEPFYSGIYFYALENYNDIIKTGKIVKQ